jgi:hypothetical protein
MSERRAHLPLPMPPSGEVMGWPMRFPDGTFKCSTCKQQIQPAKDPHYLLNERDMIIGVECRDCWRQPGKMKTPR